jgi:hypothetical protein
MEVNITTVTKTKLWAKALSRLYQRIKAVETEIEALNLTDDYCEVLQVIFEDEGTVRSDADGFVEADGFLPKKKVKQVSVTVPSGFSFRREAGEAEAIYKAVLERTKTAIMRSPLKQNNKELILEVIRKYQF